MRQMIHLENARFAWPGEKTVIDLGAFTIEAGEKVLIRGASGSGKTTLLSLLTGIQAVDEGLLVVRGVELKKLSPSRRDRFRGDHMGYIFQQFNLLPYLSVADNILSPLLFSRVKREREPDPRGKMRSLVEELSLDIDLAKPAGRLSIGQQQRVAIARALIGEPEILIADEPTSALDDAARQDFINLLFMECDRRGATLLVVSHDGELQTKFPRVELLEKLPGVKPGGMVKTEQGGCDV